MSHLTHYHLCLDCREQHIVDRAVAIAAGNADPYDPNAGYFSVDNESALSHSATTGHRLILAPATKVEAG